MQAQKIATKNPKGELYLDLIELFTGASLVLFIWTHMIFVSSMLLGMQAFTHHAENLDKYYLSYVGIPLVVIIFITHAITAGRRIPARYQEQKIILRHAKMLKGTDTWIWVFQVITGIAIFLLGIVHITMVVTQWPIEAVSSVERARTYWWFYLILVFLSLYHAGFGLYRQFVKWCWLPRKTISYVTVSITLLIVTLSLITLWVMFNLGGSI